MTVRDGLAGLVLSAGVILSAGAGARADDGRQAAADIAAIETCVALIKGDANGSACIGRVSKPCIAAPDGGTTLGMVTCYGREVAAWDHLLNRTYKEAAAAMSDGGRTYLRDAQRLWVAFRDKACAWPEQVYSGGSIVGPLGGACMRDQTARRALDLVAIKASLTQP